MADVVQMHDHAGRSHGVVEVSELERFVARVYRDATLVASGNGMAAQCALIYPSWSPQARMRSTSPRLTHEQATTDDDRVSDFTACNGARGNYSGQERARDCDGHDAHAVLLPHVLMRAAQAPRCPEFAGSATEPVGARCNLPLLAADEPNGVSCNAYFDRARCEEDLDMRPSGSCGCRQQRRRLQASLTLDRL